MKGVDGVVEEEVGEVALSLRERNLPKKLEINAETAEKPLACLNAGI